MLGRLLNEDWISRCICDVLTPVGGVGCADDLCFCVSCVGTDGGSPSGGVGAEVLDGTCSCEGCGIGVVWDTLSGERGAVTLEVIVEAVVKGAGGRSVELWLTLRDVSCCHFRGATDKYRRLDTVWF